MGVGLGKGKGKLNTIKVMQGCEFAFTLARHGDGQMLQKALRKMLADFLFVRMGRVLQKQVHPAGCALLQGRTKRGTKNVTNL